MKVQVSYTAIWQISWPIMLSSLANTVINFTDVAFVARVGEVELAASALGGIFYFLMVMISTAIGVGSQILISRKAGEGRNEEIADVFDNGFVLMMVVSLLMLAGLLLLTPFVLPLIISNEQVTIAVSHYLNARGIGLIPMGVLVSLRSFYTGITLTRIISYTTILMMVSNVILNYALVFGHWGLPAMGLTGAGLASALSETLAAVYAVLYAVFHSEIKQFRLFRFSTVRKADIRDMFNLSAPIMMQNLLSMGSWFLFFILIEKIGERELAVSNVVRSIYMVMMTPIWGFSQTSNSMVSNLIGQKREDEVLALVMKITKMSVLTCVAGIGLSVFFAGPLFLLSTSDLSVIQDARGSFYVICAATLFFSFSMVFLSAISGTGKTKAAMVIEVICLIAYIIYSVLFTVLWPAKLEVIWGAEVLYWCMMGIVSWQYLSAGKWRCNN